MHIKKIKAFSLLELLFTMCIAGVIMFISYDSLTTLKIQYRRKEAQTELLKLQSIIEQQALNGSFKSVSGSFVTVQTVLDVANQLYTQTVTNAQPIITPSSYYQITVNNVTMTSPTGYTLIATPTSTGPQAKDTSCPVIQLIVTSDSDGVNSIKKPATCWGCSSEDLTCAVS